MLQQLLKFSADEIRKVNKNVIVFQCINPNEPQFKEKTLPSDRIRVGWLGGSSHLRLMLLEGFVNKNSQINDKINMFFAV